MDIFSHIFVVKNCNVCLKRPKINQKEAGLAHFKNDLFAIQTFPVDKALKETGWDINCRPKILSAFFFALIPLSELSLNNFIRI